MMTKISPILISYVLISVQNKKDPHHNLTQSWAGANDFHWQKPLMDKQGETSTPNFQLH